MVDENGDVVALVFAATNSENFNLGTPQRDLIAAFEKYVENRDQDEVVTLEMKKVLNFKPALMLQSLSLPRPLVSSSPFYLALADRFRPWPLALCPLHSSNFFPLPRVSLLVSHH